MILLPIAGSMDLDTLKVCLMCFPKFFRDVEVRINRCDLYFKICEVL